MRALTTICFPQDPVSAGCSGCLTCMQVLRRLWPIPLLTALVSLPAVFTLVPWVHANFGPCSNPRNRDCGPHPKTAAVFRLFRLLEAAPCGDGRTVPLAQAGFHFCAALPYLSALFLSFTTSHNFSSLCKALGCLDAELRHQRAYVLHPSAQERPRSTSVVPVRYRENPNRLEAVFAR